MKRKFRADEKAIITATIPESEEAKRRRGIIPSNPLIDVFHRRNLQTIQFFDLGQVNIGSVDSPLWSDHAILKSPSYSCVNVTDGGFAGTYYQLLSFDGFDDTDYQNYTDLFFNVASVDNWKYYFRRLEYEPYLNLGTLADSYQYGGTDYPSKIIIYDKNDLKCALMRAPLSDFDSTSNPNIMIDPLVNADVTASTSNVLANHGLVWNKSNPGYKNLSYLKTRGSDAPTGSGVTSYFPFDTADKTNYKVTSVYDSSASDVGVLAPAGNTEVYLMPHLSFWMASATSADNTTKYAMFCYQINPRQYFPRYVERGFSQTFTNWIGFGLAATDDQNNRKADFLNYQMNRSGMQAVTYSRASASVTPWTDGSSMSAASFPININGYFSSTLSTDATSNFHQWVLGDPSRADLYISSPFFSMSNPFLAAVIKTRGQFYYVWDMTGGSAFYSGKQGMKYRVSRYNYSSFAASSNLTDDTEPFTIV